MNDNVFVVYNKLSHRYQSVFSSPTEATAIRSFKLAYKDQLDDYELCHVGTIGLASGVITPCPLTRVDIPHDSSIPINDIERSFMEVK